MAKRLTAILLCLTVVFIMVGCGNQNRSADEKDTKQDNRTEEKSNEEMAKDDDSVDIATQENDADDEGNEVKDSDAERQSAVSEDETDKETGKKSGSNILVVYFSRTGEQYSVGVIDKGNTAIIADMIAEKTGADTFEILPANDNYPTTYNKLTEYAQKEQRENARPEIRDTISNFSDYDTVFIGYPIWWGDLPMIVYTFLESYDFSGKTVIPFCTHEGSGLASTEKNIKSAVSAVSVEKGLAIQGSVAQNQQDKAEVAVDNWLSDLGY